MLVAAPQTAAEVVQPKSRDYCYMDSLPPVSECLDSPSMDTPDAGESRMEMAVVPDVLPTVISVRTVVSDKSMKIDTPDAVVSSMEVAGGNPPAGPDALQTAVSVTTEMLVNINTPDTVESGMEITGGSPRAVGDISVNTDVLQTARFVTTQMSEKWMIIDSPDAVDSGMEMAGGSPPAEFDISVGPDVLLTAISVTTVVSEKWTFIDRLRCGTPAPPSACSGPSYSGRKVYRYSGGGTYPISAGSQNRVSAASPQRSYKFGWRAGV